MEIWAKTRLKTLKYGKERFMRQHYLQHGHADTRVEVKIRAIAFLVYPGTYTAVLRVKT